MLAIIKQWQEGSGCHTSNTDKYLLLMVFKMGLDSVVFHFCCRKLYMSFLSICSLSILLADLLMALCILIMWVVGAENSLVSLCLLLANASAIYGALPLPMICLGSLDYYLGNTWICNQSATYRILRNLVLTLLVWVLASVYAFGSVKAELMELDYVTGLKALVCTVEESLLINYFILGLFTAVIFVMLPFWSRIPQWMQEADRLSKLREEQENQMSDFVFTSSPCMETKTGEETFQYKSVCARPPLGVSLTLGFCVFWMPYLAVTVACLGFGFGVPAYITVNLLWLECTNSLLAGVTFWVKSKKLGPYSHIPENVCLWHVYWHLSKGTQQLQLPITMFSPSKGNENTVLCII
ncbi:probable G-protein coupled receptor 160 [Channa argus]|uniref:probable G-protein coupled receptor 160 n=1 Tax=Channa argus TaxID=215402 RepID=UPI0035201ED2